jgi:hypothetical protein
MLSTFEIFLNAGATIILLPLAIQSLVTRALPPEPTFMGRLYRADPYVARVGDIFLLSLCGTALAKLALHFGYIDMGLKDRTEIITHMPFLILLVVYMTLLIRAWCKLRRTNRDGATSTSQ